MSAPAEPRRTGLLVAAIVTLGVAFFCVEHRLLVSRQEMYGTTAEDLEESAAGGKFTHQLGFSLVALLGVVFLVREGGRAWRLNGPLPVVMVAFVACCAVSCLWSTDGPRTFKRAGILVLCLTGALGLGRQLRARELCLLALAITGAYAVLGLAAELALGTFKPGGADYRFAGTLHPNGAGANVALLCLSACCLLATEKRGQLWLLALLAFGGALLVLTKSRSACAALLISLLALRLLRPSPRLVLGFFVAAWAACGLVLLAALARTDPAEGPLDFLLLGRAEHVGTLTGRTELWEELIPYAQERLLLGYGYGSFWSVDRIDEISNTVYWGLSSSHSVYLETLLGVGVVGLSLIGLTVLTGLWRAGRLYRAGGSAGHALAFCLLVYGLIGGLAESDFIAPSFVGFLAACGLAHLGFFQDESPGTRYATTGPLTLALPEGVRHPQKELST
jgi:O-antigen ligase